VTKPQNILIAFEDFVVQIWMIILVIWCYSITCIGCMVLH